MNDKIESIIDALRKKILESAIRGELVPQGPADEPASVLLERIAEEREKLIREKKIKKPKSTSRILRRDRHFYESINGGEPVCIDEQIPFDIPDSWEWVRGKSLFEPIQNKAPNMDFPYIDINAIDNNLHAIKEPKIIKAKEAPSRARRLLQPGDILFSLVRPYLENIALVESKHANAIASTGFYIVRTKAYTPKFAYALFLSPYVIQGLNSFMKGDNSPSIRGEDIEDYLYPLPPLQEQHRIVAAIEEKMERLTFLAESRKRYRRILSGTPTSLRQQLIQAAIQGKLVPQDPNDEPASKLLERIAKERERLIKEKKIKRPKSTSRILRRDGHFYESINGSEPVCIDEQIPFDIPESWEWCRLESICNINPRIKAADNTPAGFVPMTEMKEEFHNSHSFLLLPWNKIKTGYTHLQNGDIAVAKITPCFQNRKSAIIQGFPHGIGAGSTEFHVARPFPSIHSSYLLSLFKSSYFIEAGINLFTGTAGQQRVSTPFFVSFLVPLPPLQEQQRIVKKLGALLDLM